MPELISSNNWYGLATYVLITLIISTVTYLVSKNKDVRLNKNRFRQEWIDNTRNTLSEYLSVLEEHYKQCVDNERIMMRNKKIDTLYYKLLLLFNSESDNNNHKLTRPLLRELNNYITIENVLSNNSETKFKSSLDQLVIYVQQDLIKEWKKVKKGK